jgi:hypothetical protein
MCEHKYFILNFELMITELQMSVQEMIGRFPVGGCIDVRVIGHNDKGQVRLSRRAFIMHN